MATTTKMAIQNDSDLDFDDADEHDELFTLATKHVEQTHDTLLPNDLLELYGLYKQATSGQCNIAKPGLFNIQGRAKWSAWNDLGQMSSTIAKRLYVEKVQKLQPAWWELVKHGDKKASTGWVVHSIEMPPDNEYQKHENEKTVFDYVREHNLKQVEDILKPSDLEVLDENGLALIHWATDSNDVQMLEYLLKAGCQVELRDAEQQTALHYAVSCGHLECVDLLLKYGANMMAQDSAGQTCLDVADDPCVHSLLKAK
uniref:Acyl-CoA-binding domain-containing protein 6 n=2 Tax=Glossina morsitans morsitans TaxID=37546 RepID=A0A1B0GAF0_GLOMM